MILKKNNLILKIDLNCFRAALVFLKMSAMLLLVFLSLVFLFSCATSSIMTVSKVENFYATKFDLTTASELEIPFQIDADMEKMVHELTDGSNNDYEKLRKIVEVIFSIPKKATSKQDEQPAENQQPAVAPQANGVAEEVANKELTSNLIISEAPEHAKENQSLPAVRPLTTEYPIFTGIVGNKLLPSEAGFLTGKDTWPFLTPSSNPVKYEFSNDSQNKSSQDAVVLPLNLQYENTKTTNAIQTYYTGHANCLSFVNLFIGLSRAAELSSYYVEVTDVSTWYKEGDIVVHNTHMAAGVNIAGDFKIVDFLPDQPKRYRVTKPTDDLTGIAHYYNNIGAEAVRQGDYSKAVDLFRIALIIKPCFYRSYINMGVAYSQQGKEEEALDCFRKSLDCFPKSPTALTNIAAVYHRQGNDPEANKYLRLANTYRNDNPFFYYSSGQIKLANGEYEAAIVDFKKAIRRDTAHTVPDFYIALGKAYLAQNKLRKAQNAFGKALKLESNNLEALQFRNKISSFVK